MEVAREQLPRETVTYKSEADRILDFVGNDLQSAQAKTSCRLVELHATQHMTVFTEDLSKRREWLINHQPTITETISMRPGGTRQMQAGSEDPNTIVEVRSSWGKWSTGCSSIQ